MTKLFTLPKEVILTNSGALIPGAKAYFYEAGTATPLSVYKTHELTTPHSNPVLADSSGRFPAIYYGADDYKVKLTDASDVEIYSQDYAATILGAAEVGAALYPVTAEETAAGVTPTNYQYPPGNVLRYGADLTGVTASTVALQAAMDSADVLPWDGTLLIDNVTSTKATAIRGYKRRSVIKFDTPSVAGTVGITLANAGSSIKDVHIDGDTTNRTLINLTGDYCEADVTTENVDALASTETFVSGVDVNANYCTVAIFGENYTNPSGTGHSNESVPRLVTVSDPVGGTTGTYIKRAEGYNVNTGLLFDGAGAHHFDSVVLEDANDNGLYCVNDGGIVTGNYFEFRGTGTVTGAGDEPIVITTNASLHLNHAVIYGQVAACGFQDHTSLHIDRLEFEWDGVTAGPAPASIFRTRVGNTAAGRVYIGSISGRIRPQLLFQMSTGTVDYVSIRNVNVDCIYDATNSGTLSQWMIFDSCKGFDFRDWHVKIIDEDDVLTTEIFQATAPTTNLAKKSFWKNMKFEITDADETTESSAEFRGNNLAQALVYTEGAEWITNLGPRVREVGWCNGLPDSCNTIPSVGTWRVGQFLRLRTPTVDGNNMTVLGYQCTVAGSPGTWVTIYGSTVSPAT